MCIDYIDKLSLNLEKVLTKVYTFKRTMIFSIQISQQACDIVLGLSPTEHVLRPYKGRIILLRQEKHHI